MDKMLSHRPQIHDTALVLDSELGAWTEIGPEVTISGSVLGDYAYVSQGSDIIYSKIGKFCSVAARVRINPGNHPLGRAALHHFTYRGRMFRFDDDDESFFDWRRSFQVSLGHDVWIGHGAIVLPGVRLGTGAAIGAGAVATKEVAPFTIAAGVPANEGNPEIPARQTGGTGEGRR